MLSRASTFPGANGASFSSSRCSCCRRSPRLRPFFDVILPLIAPAIAITVLFGFMASWTEFVLAWTFLTDPNRFTLAMGLNGMVGQYSSNTPWSDFAAMAILITIPILVLFFLLQRWIVSGLAVGAVKG